MLSIDQRGHLFLENGSNLKIEIALVYFREGYDQTHYPKNIGWKARLTIEKSRAIKGPNLKTHLLTFKKVQFDLHENDSIFSSILNKSLSVIEKANFMKTKVEQYVVTKETANEVLKNKNLENFVLKPMTESGSELHCGRADIEHHLSEQAECGVEYILMKKINTKIIGNYLLTGDSDADLIPVGTSQELGIFGCYVMDCNRNTVFQETSGYLMRSKCADMLSGGFVNGVAAVDSIRFQK